MIWCYVGKCKEISGDGIQCNGSSSCSASAGDTLHLSCIPGNTLRGESVLTCGADGQWNNKMPSCVKTCLAHKTPPNGICSPANCLGAVGDQITFTCDSGYKLHGSAKLTCLAQGVWSDNEDPNSIPSCNGE